ncbi:unnamed protein product [Trichobilharzia szidati]|nr:unnamed protein product [Trichobilharzia szidati]
MSESGDRILLQLKHNGQPLQVDSLSGDHSVSDLKNEVFKITNILPENQKILGLRTTNNEPVTDSTKLSCLVIKANTKLMLIGSTQEAILKVNSAKDSPEVVDDFDYKEEDLDLCDVPENIEKVEKRCKAYRPRKLAEFRAGKNLLVLDIDYTIFDHLTPAESAHQLARPYLMEFLTRAYVHYDIAIWSATNMTWILAKLSQLGIIPMHIAKTFQHRTSQVDSSSSTVSSSVLTSDEWIATGRLFQIALLLDSSDMISVNFNERGIKEVKPLAVIWKNHPQWGPHNTIMFDDVRRNFIMNPQSGLRIRSYRDAHVNCSRDRELLHLIDYLELIAQQENDFTKLNHNNWEHYVHKYRKQLKLLKSQQKHLKHHEENNTITGGDPSPTVQSTTSSLTLPSYSTSSPLSSSSSSSSTSSSTISVSTTTTTVESSPVVDTPAPLSPSHRRLTEDVSNPASCRIITSPPAPPSPSTVTSSQSGQKRAHDTSSCSNEDDNISHHNDHHSTDNDSEICDVAVESSVVDSSKSLHKTSSS